MNEKRALYLIVEDQTDAQILHTILECSKYESVYHIPAGGYSNMSSVARTIRLMRDSKEADDKILVVFDSDSEKEDVIADRLATMRYLINADYDKRINVFCFVPTIEGYLFPTLKLKQKGVSDELIAYLKENIGVLREKEVIREMQAFIDE